MDKHKTNNPFLEALGKLVEERFSIVKVSDNYSHIDVCSRGDINLLFVISERYIIGWDYTNKAVEFDFDIANPEFDPEMIINWMREVITGIEQSPRKWLLI